MEGLTVAALELQEGLKQIFRSKHFSAEPPQVAVVSDAEFPDHCSPHLHFLPGDQGLGKPDCYLRQGGRPLKVPLKDPMKGNNSLIKS